MDISKILSITGKPGLYQVISQSKNGFIVESLQDKKRMPVYQSHQVSALGDISIYTQDDDVPLKDVLKSIYEKTDGKEALSAKATSDELKDFMEDVLPDYDQDRVYTSDIKKLVKWYNLLLENGFFDETETEDTEEESAADKGSEEASEVNDPADNNPEKTEE